MKILLFISSLSVGGTQRQIFELAKGLKLRNWEVVVMHYYSGGEFISILNNSGIRTICLEKKSRWDVLGFLFRMCQQVRKEDPDIFYSFLTGANVVATFISFFLGKTKLIWGVRSSDLDYTQMHFLEWISLRLSSLFSRVPDRIISNSIAGKEVYQNLGFYEKNFCVVHNGIDTDKFSPKLENRNKIRAEFKTSSSQKLVGMVARIDSIKDHECFVRAAREVLTKRSDIKFVCIGTGDESRAKKLLKLSQDLSLQDTLIWAGLRTDIVDVYSALDLHVLIPVKGEGFPNSVAEAMACEVPCITGGIGAMQEIVAEKCFFLANKDYQSLAERILGLLDYALDQSVKKRVREHIVKNFALESMITKTESILIEVLNSND